MSRVAKSQPDAAVLQGNLQVLQRTQPSVCARLRSVSVPAEVHGLVGRDGTLTFRVPDDRGRLRWLGFSSMPTISAPAIVQSFQAGDGNVLLPTLGHGGEARCLLQRLEPHQAVFAWDADPLVPSLALRLHDFRDDLENGRLLLAVGASLSAALQECLDDHPDHLPPAKILFAPHLQATELHPLQTQAEEAAGRQHARLNARLAQAADSDHRPSVPDRPRVTVLSMMVDPEVVRVAHALVGAAQRSGLDGAAVVVDRPQHAHLQAAARNLRDQPPTDVILLNQAPAEWGNLLPPVPRRSWCVSGGACRREFSDALREDDIVCAATPELAKRLGEIGRGAELLEPAADPAVFHALEPDAQRRQEYGSDVAVIMDAADLSPERLGLKWESHQELFAALVEELRREPSCVDPRQADQLISAVEQRLSMELEAGMLRSNLAGVISQRLAPTLTVLRLLPELQRAGLTVTLWGNDWSRHSESASADCRARPSAEQRNFIYNTAERVLLVRNDARRSQDLLDALAAGARVICQQPIEGVLGMPEFLGGAVPPAFSRLNQALDLCLGSLECLQAQCTPSHEVVLSKGLIEHRLQALLARR